MKSIVKIAAPLLVFMFLFALGCKKKDEPAATTTPTASAESTAVSNSVITLPTSVSNASSVTRSITRSSNETSLFSAIRDYAGMAEMFGKMGKDVLVAILSNINVTTAVKGQLYTITSSDPESPKAYKVENSDDTSYTYKVTLYNDTQGTDIMLVVRFTVEGTAAKGKLVFASSRTAINITTPSAGSVTPVLKLEVVFDGTSSNKTLEIKVVQEFNSTLWTGSDYITWLTTNYASINTTDRAALDIKQPHKVFLKATYDGTYYTISGTSWHPGFTISGDALGNGRNVYAFKAKTIANSNEDAKIYLAFPQDTAATIDWTNDSVGEIFAQFMTDKLNTYIPTDDNPDNVRAMIYAIATATTPFASDTAVYQAILTIKPQLGTSSYPNTITSTTMKNLVNNLDKLPSGSAYANVFTAYQSITRIINPAFFAKTDPYFIGTYNVAKDEFYNYSSTTGLTTGTKPTNFTTVNALDLDSIADYAPATVKAYTLTVQ
ncbi:MAG: hypothetical protein A2Y41_11295 [Spirochaetes bacterium GWB1_36_13]|nr:MAG: hypothetical protein A2Y41_11295 [Spirochaetes bacterium GWB1_36_13]